jgi:hypothetical protein
MESSTVEKKQKPLIDVPKSEAAREAERYADICDDISAKNDLLVNQGEKVIRAMKATNQKALTYTDQYGYKHTFTIVEGTIKLRHAKRQEA